MFPICAKLESFDVCSRIKESRTLQASVDKPIMRCSMVWGHPQRIKFQFPGLIPCQKKRRKRRRGTKMRKSGRWHKNWKESLCAYKWSYYWIDHHWGEEKFSWEKCYYLWVSHGNCQRLWLLFIQEISWLARHVWQSFLHLLLVTTIMKWPFHENPAVDIAAYKLNSHLLIICCKFLFKSRH